MRSVPRRHRPALLAAATLALSVLAAAALAAGGDAPSRLHLLVGRMHPLLVHLPIGFLVLAVLLEALSGTRTFSRARHAMPVVLLLGAAGAIAAVLAGYLLGASEGYEGELVAWHQRLGISVAVGAVAASGLWHAAQLRRTAWLRHAYRASLFATGALLLAAGHLGGALTHGPEHLAEHMPAPLDAAVRLLPGETAAPRPTLARADEAGIYVHLVAPVLGRRCVSCHGPERQKGGLRLDSPETILQGGESGPVVVPGRPAESELVRRVWLPEGHEEAMPPRGRRPLTLVEGELLRWWIAEGASFDQTVDRSTPPPGVQALLELLAGPPEQRLPPVYRREVARPDSAAVHAARSLGLSLRPLANGSSFLRASCVNAGTVCGDAHLRSLLPLAEQVVALDLAGASVGDPEIATIGRLRHLVRLHLERTAVTDVGLAHLAGMEHLEYLNLYGTAVTDAGLEHLASLPRLRSLFLWRTGVTPEGVERLRSRVSRLQISTGLDRAARDSLGAATGPGSTDSESAAPR